MPSFAQCLLEKRHPRPNLIQLLPEYLRFSHGCLWPSTRWWKKHIYSAWVDCTAWKFVCQEGRSADFLFSFTVPLVDKSTYAWQHVFSALFVLFALMGYDTSASQKPKITRKSKAVRCAAVLPEQKCVQATKSPQVILCVLPRALKQHGRISARQNRVCPCQLMVK